MVKKEAPLINEDNDRHGPHESPITEEDQSPDQLTYVKNAHASGVGSLGRNDEKLADSEKDDNPPSY